MERSLPRAIVATMIALVATLCLKDRGFAKLRSPCPELPGPPGRALPHDWDGAPLAGNHALHKRASYTMYCLPRR
jgi:hypothetical protein